jgi:hypothetical protein
MPAFNRSERQLQGNASGILLAGSPVIQVSYILFSFIPLKQNFFKIKKLSFLSLCKQAFSLLIFKTISFFLKPLLS